MTQERIRRWEPKSGERVSCTYIDAAGTVKRAGPHVSEVKFDDGRERFIQNNLLRKA